MRLIDANALLDVIGEEPYNWTDSETEITELSNYRYYTALIIAAPTIDAVEVIRCKDCKHWHEWENGTGMCQRSENSCFWFGVDFDDYCSFGERSEE